MELYMLRYFCAIAETDWIRGKPPRLTQWHHFLVSRIIGQVPGNCVHTL
jgi:hypothetical protein